MSEASGLAGTHSYLEGFNWSPVSSRQHEKPERRVWVAACVPQTMSSLRWKAAMSTRQAALTGGPH